MKTPEQFTPADADFCIITFTLLPSPFLSRTSLEQRNAAVWNVTGGDALNGQIGQLGATTFVAPRLDRSRSWYQSRGDRPLDVTGNIYIGARPGHNQQAEDSPHTRHTSHSVPGRYRPFCMPGPKTLTFLQLYLCDGTGQDGPFRPTGRRVRVQPGLFLQREHGLVRARRLAGGLNLRSCVRGRG